MVFVVPPPGKLTADCMEKRKEKKKNLTNFALPQSSLPGTTHKSLICIFHSCPFQFTSSTAGCQLYRTYFFPLKGGKGSVVPHFGTYCGGTFRII